MKGIFEDLARHLRKNTEELPDEVVQGMLRILESVRVEDMPCSEVYARLDEYVERELKDHEAAKVMPLLREHFDICTQCSEEYQALLDALEQSQSRSKIRSAGPPAG